MGREVQSSRCSLLLLHNHTFVSRLLDGIRKTGPVLRGTIRQELWSGVLFLVIRRLVSWSSRTFSSFPVLVVTVRSDTVHHVTYSVLSSNGEQDGVRGRRSGGDYTLNG